jgi:hypothetical protein
LESYWLLVIGYWDLRPGGLKAGKLGGTKSCFLMAFKHSRFPASEPPGLQAFRLPSHFPKQAISNSTIQ